MKLSYFLSRRFRQAKHANGFIGFIGKASSTGIALGITVLIVALSVFNGFQQQLEERLLSVIPHVEYDAPEQPISHWPQKVALLEKQPGVISAAPVIKLNGMAQFKTQLKAVEIRAIEPELELNVSKIADFITAVPLTELSDGQVILGRQVANDLGIEVGQMVTLLLPDLTKDNSLSAAKKQRLTLVGLIEMGGPVDHSSALIRLSQAQKILGYQSDEVSGLRLAVSDVFAANTIAMSAGAKLTDYVYVNTWFRSQGNLYQDIQMVRTIIYLVVFLIIAVASFNIVSTLVMEVKEKQANIAILKTMGATDGVIISTFIYQGLSQALIGMVFGTVFGVLLAIWIPDLFLWWNQLSGTNVLAGAYFVEFLPSKLVFSDVLVTLAITTLMTCIATVYPAWQASRIDPAKVLGQ